MLFVWKTLLENLIKINHIILWRFNLFFFFFFSAEFPISHKTPLSEKKRICSQNQSFLKLTPPLIHSSNCKKPATKTTETNCFQIEKTREFFSDGNLKSPLLITDREKKDIVIDNSLHIDRVFTVCSCPPDIYSNSKKSTTISCDFSSRANLCCNIPQKNDHKLFTSASKISENISTNRESKDIEPIQEISAAHLVDKDCTHFFDDINEIRDLTCCDFHKKQFSVTCLLCNLHKEQQTVSWGKWLEEISKRSESVLEESMTSLPSEKVSCYSSSNWLSESLLKGGSQPNSILKVDSNLHPNFSDFVFPHQLQSSELQQNSSCQNFLKELSFARPIEFYKYFKKFFAQ